METNNCPLVSVPVITYNSSKTVLETLESIKAQTYQNIELIISDDCSTDNTVQVCKDWIANNKERFARTVMLESPVNTGISANGNRAEDACHGEWIKTIAGDDILLPECIGKFVEFVNEHPESIFVFCKFHVFGDNGGEHSFIEDETCLRNDKMSIMSSEEQLDFVMKGLTPPAPCLFYCAKKARQLGVRNDERIKMIEDWPKWIQYLTSGNKFLFIDEFLVKYRVGGISTSQKWQSPLVFKSKRQVYYYYLFEKEYAQNKQDTLDRLIEFDCNLYNSYWKEHLITERIRRSIFYKLYQIMRHLEICKHH